MRLPSIGSPSAITLPFLSMMARSHNDAICGIECDIRINVRPLFFELLHLVKALSLEGEVTDGENFIDKEDIGLVVHGYSEPKRTYVPEE
jgi:hypothetical protein